MRRLILMLGLLLGWGIAMHATELCAQSPRVPSYLMLRAPKRPPHSPPYYPGRGYEVRSQTYAYGWFGAQPRSHWYRHEGYNSAYIQWTKR
ncbi:MAG: hypothetical protein GXY58_10225 [Planctomycetaceae bacterium]|nr:hypothetical protein [Planctomycetaceae bacterium]